MWFLLLIFAFTTANLVEEDDNIAMESQATQYRAKYYRPEVYQRAETQYSPDYETSEYSSHTASSGKRPKKYYSPKSEKENVAIIKNYAVRAREPRDEAPWKPVLYQTEEETRQSSNDYRHQQESESKPQKQFYYYASSSEGSKQPKKQSDSTADQQRYVQRYKTNPQPATSNYHERPQEEYQTDLNHPSQPLQTPFAYLQRFEENMNDGKMLGYTSLVEHFSDDEINDDEMKVALREGSLDDIKKIIPKSGAVFKMYHDEEAEKVQYVPEQVNNNVDQNDVAPSASSYNYAKPNQWVNYRSQQSAPAPTRASPPVEKKKSKKPKAVRLREPPLHYSTEKQDESVIRPVRSEEPRPASQSPHYHPNQEPTKHTFDYPSQYNPTMEETRVYPQIEAASKQNYRPIQSVLPDHNDYLKQHLSNNYYQPQPQKSALQLPLEPSSEENTDHYYTSNIKTSYTNKTYNPATHLSHTHSSSEMEINQSGGSLGTVIHHGNPVKQSETPKHNYYDHRSPPKQPETLKHNYYNHESPVKQSESLKYNYYDHGHTAKQPETLKHNFYDQYKHPNHLIQSNNKPESFDHQKALQGSFSFNSGNILGNSYPVKDEPINVEASRSPIQFASGTEHIQKPKSPPLPPKHIQKYAEDLFKNMYKTKDESAEEEQISKIPKPYRYQLELVPRPSALVSMKHPKFEAETPMMTEEEFQLKFGHLPLIVTTPKAPFFASTVSTPVHDLFDIKVMKPQAEALTQFWPQPEKEIPKFTRPQAETLTQHWPQTEKESPKYNKYTPSIDFNPTKYKKPATTLSPSSIKYPVHKFNDVSEESSNTVLKQVAKGQVERPTAASWKNGKIYLTKEYEGKLSDLYIKSSDKENLHSPSSHSRPSRPHKQEGSHKNIYLGSNFTPYVQEMPSVKYLKYDVSLSPSYRFQKREDPDDKTKNISIVSEDGHKSHNREKKTFKKQGIVLTSSNNNSNRDTNQFQVSASYQIDRSDKNKKGNQ